MVVPAQQLYELFMLGVRPGAKHRCERRDTWSEACLKMILIPLEGMKFSRVPL